MDLSAGAKRLLLYWGPIQALVSARATTAQLWDQVRQLAERDGVSLAPAGAIDMGTVRSIAAGQRNAMEGLDRLPDSAPLTAAVIATDVSARSQALQNADPVWLVRFEHLAMVNGELQTLWRTSYFDGFLPPTKGGLVAEVEGDAIAMADDYGVTHVGIGAIQISAV